MRLLNRYFTVMSEPIRDQKGILDKFIGDAIMAYWGPPFTGEHEHAALACFAALDSRARLDAFRALLPEITGLRRGIPAIGVRMGLASGDVTIGNIGSELSKGFTVIGDTVNLASRLEGANKEYGTWILMSEDTWRLAGDAIEAREIDAIRVLGKSEPVRIFELIGRKGDPNPLKAPYEEALAHYRTGNLDESEKKFSLLKNDPPAAVMLARIAYLREHPEARRADGVWDLTRK